MHIYVVNSLDSFKYHETVILAVDIHNQVYAKETQTKKFIYISYIYTVNSIHITVNEWPKDNSIQLKTQILSERNSSLEENQMSKHKKKASQLQIIPVCKHELSI